MTNAEAIPADSFDPKPGDTVLMPYPVFLNTSSLDLTSWPPQLKRGPGILVEIQKEEPALIEPWSDKELEYTKPRHFFGPVTSQVGPVSRCLAADSGPVNPMFFVAFFQASYKTQDKAELCPFCSFSSFPSLSLQVGETRGFGLSRVGP